MDKGSGTIEHLLKGMGEAEALLNTGLTPEIEKHMTAEDLEKLEDMRKLTGVDIPNASKELEKINMKYGRNANTNS